MKYLRYLTHGKVETRQMTELGICGHTLTELESTKARMGVVSAIWNHLSPGGIMVPVLLLYHVHI